MAKLDIQPSPVFSVTWSFKIINNHEFGAKKIFLFIISSENSCAFFVEAMIWILLFLQYFWLDKCLGEQERLHLIETWWNF